MKNKLLLRGKILAFVSLTVLASTAFSKNTDTRIQIAFLNTQNDKEIATILDSYPVTPTAGFMWVEGLSGTHRTHEDLGSEKFIQEARIQTIIFLKNGLIAHRTHIKKILDKHSKNELVENKQLLSQARSLLNLTQQFSNALQAASSDQPLIYGLELMGESHILEQVRTASKVSSSKTVGEITANNQEDNYESLKPAFYKSEFKDQSIQSASPEKIYELLHTANLRSRKGDS